MKKRIAIINLFILLCLMISEPLLAISGLNWHGENDYAERQAWREAARERARQKKTKVKRKKRKKNKKNHSRRKYSNNQSYDRENESNNRETEKNSDASHSSNGSDSSVDDEKFWQGDSVVKPIDWRPQPFLIPNGPQQYITKDMDYESLCDALYQYFDESEKGKEKEKSSWKSFEKIINNKTKSYGIKKRAIYEKCGGVISYIQNEYHEPLEVLEEKYLHMFSDDMYKTSKNREWLLRSYLNKIIIGGEGVCKWHLTALAQRGSAKAQFLLGLRLHELLKDSILHGHQIPLFNQGISLETLIKRWVKEDITWFKLAAESGNLFAYLQLGVCCIKSKNYKNAIDWLKKGAYLGQVDCMHELGELTIDLTKDYDIALHWFELASEQNHISSTKRCAEIYAIKTENRKPDYRKAINYYEKLIRLYKEIGYSSKNIKIQLFQEDIEALKLKIED